MGCLYYSIITSKGLPFKLHDTIGIAMSISATSLLHSPLVCLFFFQTLSNPFLIPSTGAKCCSKANWSSYFIIICYSFLSTPITVPFPIWWKIYLMLETNFLVKRETINQSNWLILNGIGYLLYLMILWKPRKVCLYLLLFLIFLVF